MRTDDNPLRQLQRFGQSVWLDDLSDRLLRTGELARLIAEDGISGITSNPTILGKAIGEDREYTDQIRRDGVVGDTTAEIAENLMVALVGKAADALRPVYDRANGGDGFVSLEVSPTLADDTPGTVVAAWRLWHALARPNVMIKVPATPAGLPAIRQLLAEGVNVNITLIFGLARYREVLRAFAAGLEERSAAGQPLDTIRSVASVFISRIDTLVDRRLEAPDALALRGHAGVAVARSVYQDFKQFSASAQWQRLRERGAHPQRPLWASTSTKNPAYSDVKYIEALIGDDTVTTVPLETLARYRDHGRPAVTLETELAETAALPAQLLAHGVDLERVSEQLEREGVRKFADSYEELLRSVETLRAPPGR